MSYCNFFNKAGGNQAEPLGEDFKTTYDPDFDSASVRTKIEDGFHSLVSSETGEPIVGVDSQGNFLTQAQKDNYKSSVGEQLKNDPASRRGKFPESFQDREDRLSFNDPTGEAKRRLLAMSEENDRIARSGFTRDFPEGSFLSFEKAPLPNSSLPDLADLIRSQPANPNVVPAEYKTPEFNSNKEVIPDSGKNLGDVVRTEQLSQTNLKPNTGTQLDNDELGAKPPKVKQNSSDAKGQMLTEDDLDERSIGDVVGSVGSKVLGLAGLGLGIGETLKGKGTTKQKATAITEQFGAVAGQEAGEEGIKRLNLTKRYRNLSNNQREYAKSERDKIEQSEGREMNADEAENILNEAEKLPALPGPNLADEQQSAKIVASQEQSVPTMNSESQAQSQLNSGSEVKFSDSSDAFTQGGASSEASGMGPSVAKNPETKVPKSGPDEGGDGGDGLEDTIEKAGTKALGETGEIDAIGGGPEDPIGDVIAGVVGLGTLLGGIFGDKEKKVAPKLPPPPNVEQAVQIGVDI